jgi:5-methylcytosine-specific restriction enzyme A
MVTVKTRCVHPGCRQPADNKGRCVKHAEQAKAERLARYQSDPFYKTAAWKAVRDQRRELNRLCQECEQQGRVTAMWAVDHILPRSTHPELELELENTRSLCESHHNARTQRDRHASKAMR